MTRTKDVLYKLHKHFVVFVAVSFGIHSSGLLCDSCFGILLFGHFGRFQGVQLELCHMARPAMRFIRGSNSSSHTFRIPFACSQPWGQYVEGVHQKALICIYPREPPGSLALKACGVQFDSRFKTRIRVGVSHSGQPTLKARLRPPTQAVTGVVLEVVVGSGASGIVA